MHEAVLQTDDKKKQGASKQQERSGIVRDQLKTKFSGTIIRL